MPVMQQPEAYIGGVDKLVDEQGRFTQDATREFGARFMSAFEAWIRRNTPAR